MSIDATTSSRPLRALDVERLDAPAPVGGVDRLLADSDLILCARSLLLRATSSSSRSAGRTLLANSIARLLGSAPSASVNRERLEAFATAEQLLDPIARLTSEVEAPPRPTFSWSSIAADAAVV